MEITLTTILFLGLYGIGLLTLYKVMRLGCKIDDVKKSNGTYQPSVTLWKFLLQILFGGSSLVILDVASNYVTQLQNLNSPITVVILIAILNAVSNYIKNR
ncbi:MAG: hypothetical protein JW700_00760 [Candidatus Aenigmarchaeota archaeon]|nr:hypothetical protein [Candidatus Aenigmarchaeota archaeon]